MLAKTLLVDEVSLKIPKASNVNHSCELWDLIQASFGMSPVEPILPISRKSFNLAKRRSTCPMGIVDDLVGKLSKVLFTTIRQSREKPNRLGHPPIA